MTWLLGGVALSLGAWWLWRTVGFIRMETPLSEQRKQALQSDGVRYRQTQPANKSKLALPPKVRARLRRVS